MKKSHFLMASVVLAALSGEAVVDVSGSMVSIANPNGTSMDAKGRANTPWCMQAFDGGIYVGYGDYDYNAGPVPAWRYDAAQEKWVNEGNLPTEQLAFFYEFSDGNLYAPDIDNHGVDTLTGQIFRRKKGSSTWETITYTTRQSTQNNRGQHNFSMAEYPQGRLWTAGYGICYADNYGTGVASGAWPFATINDFSYPASDSSNDGIRLYPYLPFANGLFVAVGYDYTTGYMNTVNNSQRYWQWNESASAFDLKSIPFATMFPGFVSSTVAGSGDLWTYTYSQKCRPGKSIVFKGNTYYNIVAGGSDYLNGVPWGGFWSATLSGDTISAHRLAAFPAGDAVTDFFIHNGRLYTLSLTYENDSTVRWHIRRTTDGENFNELFTWTAADVYRSCAFLDGYFYLGVWTKDRWGGSKIMSMTTTHSNGEILRFAAPSVDTPYETEGPVFSSGRGTVTASISLANIVEATSVTIEIDGTVLVSESGVTADGTWTATKPDLRVGDYRAVVTLVADDDTKSWTNIVSVTDSNVPELSAPSAAVANDGRSVTLSVGVISLPNPPATLSLTHDGTNAATRSVSAKGTETFLLDVVRGSTNSYSFTLSGSSGSATVYGTFIATVYTNWFTVNFAGSAYSAGSDWVSAASDPDGSWTSEGTEGTSLDATSRTVRSGEYSSVTFSPVSVSESKADVEVSGRIIPNAGYELLEPEGNPMTALAFVKAEGGAGLAPRLWDGSAWAAPSGEWDISEGAWIAWTIFADLSSTDAPRARVTIGSVTSGWTPLSSSARSVARVRYVGEGEIGSFRGDFYSHMIGPSLVIEIPKPVFGGANGNAAVAFDAAQGVFSVTIVNGVGGAYYAAFTATDLNGPWTRATRGFRPAADGSVTLTVDADAPAKFLKVVASDAKFTPDDE